MENEMYNHLNGQYIKALKAINKDSYGYDNLWQVVEDLIADYLLRENGRLGKIIGGKFIIC